MTPQEYYTRTSAPSAALFGEPVPSELPAEEVSLLRLINGVLRLRRLVIACMLGLGAIVAVWTLVSKPKYSSTALFVPHGSQGESAGVSGIAAQLGLGLPGGDLTQSPQFYADMLVSRPLLRSIVDAHFIVATDSGSRAATLADLYGGGEPSESLRRERAIDLLHSQVSTEISPRTGVIELMVTVSEPALAQQIASRMLAYLSEFNLERRQSQAGAERRFSEQRLTEARAAQRSVEDDLLSFLQRNRDYVNSPSLRFQQERLSRTVVEQQQLIIVLKQAYERARLDEIRDTPVLTILEAPELPARPDARRLATRTILAVLAGMSLGISIAVLREWFGANRGATSQDALEFARLRRDSASDLMHPWRLLFRRGARGTVAGEQ